MEIFLAALTNLQRVTGMMFFVILFALVCYLFFWSMEATVAFSQGELTKAKTCRNWALKRILILLLVMVPVLTIPSIDDVWRIRIALIKFNLASPENIQKSSEEIVRIAQKLECKYLGCEEKK